LQRIIIFANGDLPDISKARTILKDDDYIICADGGTRHTSALDIRPDLVIGDMDSTDKGYLQKLQSDGVLIELFPQDKNETDLELAIQRAIELAPKEITIVAGLGGRIDQTLANITLLSNLQHSTFDSQVEVHGRSGDVVSLIPWQGPVHGIQTENLKWHLDKETLLPENTRGISNEMTADVASIKISSGVLLIVHTRKS
jgi:thiamine pyrophosphokinase